MCLNLSFVLCQQLVKLGGVWSITTWHILHLLLLITGNSEYVKWMWWQRLKILLSNTGRCATCKLLWCLGHRSKITIVQVVTTRRIKNGYHVALGALNRSWRCAESVHMFHDVSIHIITRSSNMLNEGVNCGLIKCEAKIPLYVYVCWYYSDQLQDSEKRGSSTWLQTLKNTGR